MPRLPNRKQNCAFAAVTDIGNRPNFECLGFGTVRALARRVSLTEALAETEKLAHEKDESGRYMYRPDVSGPALLGLSRLLNHEMDELIRDASEMIARVNKNSNFWKTFDVELAREKQKTLEELSQVSSCWEGSQQPGVVDVDDGDFPGLEIGGMGHLAENVVDENVDPITGRPKRNRKNVKRGETGETGLAGTTAPEKRKKRKLKAKDLNVIEDAAIQEVNDELVNEVNELQNNFQLLGVNAQMPDDGELPPLQDMDRQIRLMQENNLMLREEPVNLENRSLAKPEQNADQDLGNGDGFDIDNLGDDNLIVSTGNDVFLSEHHDDNLVENMDIDMTVHGNQDTNMTFDDNNHGVNVLELVTPGPSTSHPSVERGRGNKSHVSEGVSAGPVVDLQTLDASGNPNASTVNQQLEQPAQSTSNIIQAQASAVELMQVGEDISQNENALEEYNLKKRRRKQFLDRQPKIKLNFKSGEHGILQLIKPFEAIELPGKIPKPFQKSDFARVFGRPMAAQLQGMVLNALDHQEPLINIEDPRAHEDHQTNPQLDQTVGTRELSTVVVAEEYPTMLENMNGNDQGTHNDTTHVVNSTSTDHQQSKERGRDNNDTNQDEGTPSRFKRPRSLSSKRSSTRKSLKTPGVSTPTGNMQDNLPPPSFQNRLPSPAPVESIEVDLSPDLFGIYDDNPLNQSLTSISSSPSDEINILRQRIIDAAALYMFFHDEFKFKTTEKIIAASAFFQAMVVFAKGQIYILQRVPTCEEITESSDEIHPMQLLPYSSKTEHPLLAILPPGHVATYTSDRARRSPNPIDSSPKPSTSRAAYANHGSSPIASTSQTAYANQRSSPIASTSRAALARFE